jgi:molybdopterin/thiamine biosynthesis adenylyltransferase
MKPESAPLEPDAAHKPRHPVPEARKERSTVRVTLKDAAWERVGDVLVVVSDPRTRIELDDPNGSAEALLGALADGPLTLQELAGRLARAGIRVTEAQLSGALDAFDSLKLLEDADRRHMPDPGDDERFHSNLAFFGLFATLGRGRAAMQEDLRGAHVLQLGTGGVGANVLQSLSGLGVGRLTLLDADLVEPRNFARQFVYRHQDIGSSKVERAAGWVRAYDPRIEVDVVERWITGPQDIADLLDGVDVVSSAVDRPAGVDLWVNEACMRAGIPWVRGGVWGNRAVYYSVDPGVSSCLACQERDPTREPAPGAGAENADSADFVDLAVAGPADVDGVAERLSVRIASINRAIGPLAALTGSLVALEVLRYLLRHEPPQAAGATVVVDVAGGVAQERHDRPANPRCPLCSHARNRVRESIGVGS